MNAWTMLALDFMVLCGFICAILVAAGKDRK